MMLLKIFVWINIFITSSLLMAMEQQITNSVIEMVMEDRALRVLNHSWLEDCCCERPLFTSPHNDSCYMSKPGTMDCSGLAHFMCTGKNGSIENIANRHLDSPVTPMDGVHQITARSYQPYTIYALVNLDLDKSLSTQHYFIYLEDGDYLSRNALWSPRLFESFAQMVMYDGYPRGMPTKTSLKDGLPTKDLKNAYFGDRIACDHTDIIFTEGEFQKFKDELSEEGKEFFRSRIH